MSPQPKTGAPLSSEDVGLLVAGDVLRHAEGVFRHVRVRDCGDVVVDAPVLTPYDRPEAFTFIGRPDADGWIPAPEGGWGENPVPGVRVDVRYRGSANEPPITVPSDGRDWTYDERYPGSDIIAIRLPDHISSAGEKVEPADPGDAIDQFISDAIANGSVEIDGDNKIGWTKPHLEWTLIEALAGCGYEISALHAQPQSRSAEDQAAFEFIATGMGFSGPNEQDTPLQSAAREVGWMLSDVIDLAAWEKRGQIQNALGRLAVAIDAPQVRAQPKPVTEEPANGEVAAAVAREEIARIIDPAAFKRFDKGSFYADDIPRQKQMEWTPTIATALGKADAILAIRAKPADGGLREALERIATVDMGGGFLGAQACRQVASEALAALAAGESA